MKIFLKLIAVLFTGLIIVCGISFLRDKARLGQWTIDKDPGETELSWVKFYWVDQQLGERHHEKTAMFLPARIDRLPYTFAFQFDLGSDLTMLYGQNAASVSKVHKEFADKITRLKSPLQFWNSKKAFKDITLHLGGIKVRSEHCYVRPNFGEEVSLRLDAGNPISIGTIGADLFQGKVLILDYPNERFAVCDSLPGSFNIPLTDIELDGVGRVILPLHVGGRTYRALFDNGSSLFPLLVTDDKINLFSTSAATDTIEISSWGTTHKVMGRRLKDSFKLGGQSFAETLVYADYRKEARTERFDAIAGNALFWNRIVIIDFKNRKFGVK